MFSKKTLINAALVLCSILFSLFIAEVFLRSVKPYFLTARFLLPPNLDVKFKTLEFDTKVKTNSIGIRDEREYSLKHNGKFRIAVIGDSFTFGWGVNNGETFPAKLEVAPDSVKASTEFVINRQDFAITYPGRPDDLVQDNVVLTLSFVAPRS